MAELAIIGAGGHGKVVAETAEAMGYRDIVFLDETWPNRRTHGRWPLTGRPDLPVTSPRFCAVGSNTARARLFRTLELDRSPVLIHPSTTVSPSALIGAGTLLVAGAIVNADSILGRGVILNTGCSVDHDCKLGDFVHVSPGARLAGNVSVGTGAWIGIGAVIREGISIGRGALVAAGAAVVENVEEDARVGGVPAQPI